MKLIFPGDEKEQHYSEISCPDVLEEPQKKNHHNRQNHDVQHKWEYSRKFHRPYGGNQNDLRAVDERCWPIMIMCDTLGYMTCPDDIIRIPVLQPAMGGPGCALDQCRSEKHEAHQNN